MKRIYLDSATSTPLAPKVLEAMEKTLVEIYGSAAAPHRHGILQRDLLKQARAQVASWVGGKPEEIFFTSSGTEAANLAIIGSAHALTYKGRHMVIGAGEHPSVWRSAEFLQKEGFEISWVPMDENGVVEVESFKELLRPDTVLVAIQHANLDVGAIQPVGRIAKLVKERGIRFYSDATASAGWIHTDVSEIGADLVSFSPHHFFGPKGVGFLWKKTGVEIEPLLWGGHQEGGLRAGTENIPAIVGAGVAAASADEQTDTAKICRELQKTLLQGISDIPYLRLNGPKLGDRRLPHHLSLSFSCVEGEALALRLDLQGFAVTSVTGCSTKESKIPRTLRAMNVPEDLALGSVIIGLSPDLGIQDIEGFALKLRNSVDVLRKMSPRWRALQEGQVDPLVARELESFCE